jgi:hypothetical protein
VRAGNLRSLKMIYCDIFAEDCCRTFGEFRPCARPA